MLQAVVAELIKGDFEEDEAHAIAAALAKICGVKKVSDLAHIEDEDMRGAASEAQLSKVATNKLVKFIASKAAPKAASAAAAVPPPPPEDRKEELVPAKVRRDVYRAAIDFAFEVRSLELVYCDICLLLSYHLLIGRLRLWVLEKVIERTVLPLAFATLR